MGKDDQQIMVVPRIQLFGQNDSDSFHGFKPYNGGPDYHDRILKGFTYMRRGNAEEDPTHKQPIGYAIVVRPSDGQVFAYKRASKDDQYKEKRLQGKYSIGLGGHIEKADSVANPIHTSLLREMEEEVGLKSTDIKDIRVLGFINDDTNPVGKVHFGVLYLLETEVQSISPQGEIDHCSFYGMGDLEKLVATEGVSLETWSQIALDPLKAYFSRK